MTLDLQRLRSEWFGNPRGDILAGLVVALALIPEAIAFSIIAGVDPKVGLYASFCIAVTIAIVGGRPGMISAATGAMALVMADLVKNHGLDYLLAATLLTGVIQIALGTLRLGRYMRFVSRSVMTGFVNALAILIFMAQTPELIGVTWQTYAMVAGGLAMLVLWPRLTKAVPAPLVAIAVLTAIALTTGADVRTVGDMGQLPTELPAFALPNVPLTLETLWIILPVSITLSFVGLLESLMTAAIVDEMTDTRSDKNREARGQGIANIVAGLFGGMAGCAMIGQSVINVTSGGRGRLSTFVAGSVLLVLVVALQDWLVRIPMAALVAVMIMVSVNTFDWNSLRRIRTMPFGSTVVMLVTTATIVATHDLSKGVFVGVLLSAVFFVRKIARHVGVRVEASADGRQRTYHAHGQVFFASAERFARSFDNLAGDNGAGAERVVIDLARAHFWDLTAVAAIDKVVMRLRRAGAEVRVVGLNEASATLVDRLGRFDKAEPAADFGH